MDLKIFAKTVEETAKEQIDELANFEAYKDSKIRIMPDCHAGAGCTIGTTMLIKDKLTPNLVGVDIGCGILTEKLSSKKINLKKLDEIINKYIPSGFSHHLTQQADFDFDRLISKEHLNIEIAKLSIGSLGGGNHFIEANKDKNGNLYIVIHSGSRNIGYQVARYYQKIAQKNFSKEQEDLAYLEGNDLDNYLHDMKIMQEYASLSRKTMMKTILRESNLVGKEQFETIHNYVDFETMILRKGAISAQQGEKVLIPMNMRDGSIIAIGKGNPDWNYSAPHGAGRLMSRKRAKRTIDFNKFKDEMKGIYSTSICGDTLDEAPDAYKPMEEIIEQIKDTVEVVDIIKPIYNFKAH